MSRKSDVTPLSSLTCSATGLPTGLSINSTSGLMSGTVGSGAVSGTPHAVTVSATDGAYTSSQTFPWSVGVISISSPGDKSKQNDDTVSLSVAASYHGTGTLSYTGTGLPGGLSVNSATGLISGTLSNTADASGPYSVTVTATDGTATAGLAFAWNVRTRVSVKDQLTQAFAYQPSVSSRLSVAFRMGLF